jgi:hypothetical protein
VSRQTNINGQHFEAAPKRSVSHALLLSLLVMGTSIGFCEGTSFPQGEAPPLEFELAWSTDAPDRDGLNRDTWYFLGYQVAAIGILYAMPESVTGWTDEQKNNYSISDWWNNVTNPGCDSDDFFINYVTHPYWGAAYYVRASERGYDSRGAFWYSVLLSSLYEFGAEALFEEPSVQDLIITPTLGSLVGHYFMSVRHDIRAQSALSGQRTTGQKWVMVLTDPLGALNRQVDKLFGYETSLQIYPYFYAQQPVIDPGSTTIEWRQERLIGLRFHFRW